MQAWKGVYIDAGACGNEARFINHSCFPNCEARTWLVKGLPRVGIYAKGLIAVGSEITYNYGSCCGSVIEGPCKCGHVKCRKSLPPGDSPMVCLTPGVMASPPASPPIDADEEDPPPKWAKRRRPRGVARLRHPGVNPDLRAFVEGSYAPPNRRARRGGSHPGSVTSPPTLAPLAIPPEWVGEWNTILTDLKEQAAFMERIAKDWQIFPMVKDGNCLFSALSKALTWQVTSATDLRLAVVDHIQSGP